MVDDRVADDDDCARNVVSDECHRDHEHRILVRQKHALVVQRSLHPVADDRIQDHYRCRHPKYWQQLENKLPSIEVGPTA